ncbi:hypothetical protein AB0F52_00720 [Amycolatopsis sp. NPDC024027]|uniref:hypothetical protein n=1 Tax=Amycolatopsis sp. NPDC024027 TaxID=3154327 RepID=UPI0033E91311
MPDNPASGHSTATKQSQPCRLEPIMEIAAITAAISTLLIAAATATVALAATFRRRANTRNDAYRVLQLLIRRQHKK